MDKEISKAEKWRRKRRNIIIAAGVSFGAVGLVWWLSSLSMNSVARSDLRTATVDRGNVSSAISTTGQVVAATQLLVNSPVSSRILAVNSRTGDIVEAGTPLVTLDLEDTRSQYLQKTDRLHARQLELEQQLARDRTELSRIEMDIEVAQMKLRALEVELVNEKYLDSIGSGTGERVRKVQFDLDTQRLSLRQLRQQLENERTARRAASASVALDIEILRKDAGRAERLLADAAICAPCRSTVTDIVDRVGAQVEAGQQLAVLSDLNHFKVEASAPDIYAGSITVGTPVDVIVESATLSGTINAVSPTTSDGRLTFTIALGNDSSQILRHGQRPDVYVNRGMRAGVLRIPNGSFYTVPGNYQLYVVRGNELQLTDVRLGEAGFDYIEVIGGLSEGDVVATTNLSRFNNAKIIKIK